MADIYQAKDFEDWYMHFNDGAKYTGGEWTRTENMNDYDYQLGQKLYNLYKQSSQYQTEHDNAAAASAERMAAAKVSADVSRQRLEKYLPQQLALQGLYGTGMSEDAYLKLQSQYQGAVSDANKQHEANLADYKSTLDAQKIGLDTQAQAAVDGVLAKKEADDEKVKVEQQAAFTEASEGLDSMIFESDKQVNEYLSKFTSRVSDSQLAQLQNKAAGIVADIDEFNEQKAKAPDYRATMTNTSFLEVGNMLQGGDNLDVKFNINGKSYKFVVESDGQRNTADLVAHANNVENNTFFAYNGNIYVKFGDVVYAVRSKGDSAADDDHYKQLKEYLTTGRVTTTNGGKAGR